MNGVMYLPEDKSEVYDDFVSWVYRENLPSISIPKNTTPLKALELGSPICWRLFDIFCLAEKYCMNELANKCADAIRKVFLDINGGPATCSARIFYPKLKEGSKLRLWIAAMHAKDMVVGAEKEKAADYAALCREVDGYAGDLLEMQRLHQRSFVDNTPADPRIVSLVYGSFTRCYFHTHGEGEICHLDQTPQISSWIRSRFGQ